MKLPTSLLSPEEVKEIKSLLWAGHLSQPEIAYLYKTHQAGISNILNGKIWEDIEWPYGDIGGMDPERHKVITSSRKRSARYASDKKEGKPSKATTKVLEGIHRITNPDPDNGKDSKEDSWSPGSLMGSKAEGTVWNFIHRLDPYHAVVRQLKREEPNPALKTATCLILTDIPANEWSRKSVIAAIYQLSHFIKNTA